ncbi:MAG: agmatinase [Candidatus Tectomicrobia bacterium]|nr:agmatinase [Candidatus Tectomicrobia bacterium]
MNLPGPAERFLAAAASYDEADWVLLGFPLEETVTFRPGTREGPRALRSASEGLETYSPLLDRDLEEIPVCDRGDLEIPPVSGRGDAALAPLLSRIRGQAARVLADGKRLLALGGEHLLTLPLVEAALSRHTDLAVVQIDAHADLRDSYEGRRLSHATVMRRVLELAEGLVLVQVGVRSGIREEMDLARQSVQVLPCAPEALFDLLDGLSPRPLYLSLDLDVLDPGVLPGTGTPEPGGWTFRELERILHRVGGRNLIGADVVELSPVLDPSGISAVTAARCVREILLSS